MSLPPLAGQPATAEMLVDVEALERGFFDEQPDPVAFPPFVDHSWLGFGSVWQQADIELTASVIQ